VPLLHSNALLSRDAVKVPVSPTLKVLAYNTYLRTNRRWVALCVVNDGSRNSIRFYKWRWDEVEVTWKVDLARFSIEDIDLRRLMADAIQYARAFKVDLDWM
jgi:hypothetical protein